MNLDINLKFLNIQGVKVDDTSISYNNYSLNVWNIPTEIEKLIESQKIMIELFFQDTVVIDEKIVKEFSEVNEYDVAVFFSNLLFNNIANAMAMQKYTLAKFNDIEEGDSYEGNPPSDYTVFNESYKVYDFNELKLLAEESTYDYVTSGSFVDYTENNIIPFLNIIDTKDLLTFLIDEYNFKLNDNEDIKNFKKLVTSDDKKMTIALNVAEEKNLIDYEQLAKEIIDNDEEIIIDEISKFLGEHLQTYKISVPFSNGKDQFIYIFDNNF